MYSFLVSHKFDEEAIPNTMWDKLVGSWDGFWNETVLFRIILGFGRGGEELVARRREVCLVESELLQLEEEMKR